MVGLQIISSELKLHNFKIEITRFTLVGAANFILTLFVFTLFLKVLEAPYTLSLLLAWVTGMIFSYVLNHSWVFRPQNKLQFKTSFVKFVMAGLVSILLNLLLLISIVEYIRLDPFHAQIMIMPVVVAFNFLTAKYWSLKKLKD